ncbi:FecCD family ABC transporter permease [Paenibacillus sp. Leaf72]|uniref:FecCD family ABC transporter permease n=1 Tax=Paenibacillus sp. Leaf72 TaxID=1736234 RepID=UPI0006F40A77|nr:iron ABC transporter permease [Paenibacillus sp. Leaf72]KQO14746.1 iron ABC transporter [Paenibacillus sp. Leaf72]
MSKWMERPGSKLAVLAAGVVILLICMLASVLFGLQQFGLKDLWLAYSQFDGSNEHLILTHTRMPRALIAAVVGASLAVAGAIMQVLTRNPLASPSIFGINSGAVLFIVVGLALVGSSLTMSHMIGLAFIGAAVTAVFVYALGMQGRGGFEPIRLTLAGACVAAFASSVTSGLILINKQSLESALFWMIGSVSGRELNHLVMVLPYIIAGLLLAFLLSGSLNVMALGDDNAKGLGQRLMLIRLLCTAAVVLLAGSAVSAAGPIAFIGLVIPHLCRALVGNDHRWLLPYCAVAGALLLVAADLLSRFVLLPKEVPVGVATALIGVPFLIHVARRKKYA